MRSHTILGRLHRIRTSPIDVVTRTHLIQKCGIGEHVIHRPRRCLSGGCSRGFRRGLSQQAGTTFQATTTDQGVDFVVKKESGLPVSITTTRATDHAGLLQPKGEIKAGCGDVPSDQDDDDIDPMEQEDMFVEAHESFDHTKKEWGGPRRGGRLPEPTRFGDWERNGRCSDF
jgi:Protein of unknown function (DUF1674)